MNGGKSAEESFFNLAESVAGRGPLRVLLVEDDAVDRMAVRRAVTQLGLSCQVTEAETLAAARERLAAETFDMLVMDGRLPDGSGFDFVPETNGTPVVFVTGESDISRAVAAMRAGAVDYLVKDTSREYLRHLPAVLERVRRERQTRELVQRSRELCERVFDEAPLAKVVVTRDGRIVRVNEAAAAMFGREAAELRRGGLAGVLGAEGAAAVDAGVWQAIADGGRQGWQDERRVRRADGTELEIQVHGRRLTVGELTGELAILQLRDVTEARKLARRQRLLEEQLEQARKLEAIGTLAGGIAHEFNNRLTAILGFLQLAGLELDASLGAQALLREASKSCRSAATLVQRMLDFSRQSAGPRSPQALAALLERALPAWAGEVPTGVTVELTAERDCPPVWCHPESLLEAVRQLVRNAGWAMKQRGGVVRVAVRSGRAEPALRSRHPDLTDDHAVSVEVGDTGPGMTPEEVRRAFEPFYTTREPGSGEGLGLPVVYAIMKRHRGVVTIDSTPGVGTRVRLFLGVRPDGPAPGAKAAGGQSGHAGG